MDDDEYRAYLLAQADKGLRYHYRIRRKEGMSRMSAVKSAREFIATLRRVAGE